MKKLFGLILFVLSFAQAQNSNIVEYNFYYSFGFSEFDFNSVPGVSISYFPTENFGFSAGVEYSWRFRDVSKKNIAGSNAAVFDSEGDEFIFNYELKKIEEEQKAQILQVPLMLKFKKSFYYGGLGLTLGFTKDIKVKGKYKDLTTNGYYPEFDLTLTEPQFQGFGNFPDSQFNDRIKTKTVYMFAIENGIRKKFTEHFGAYIAFLWNYSFNSGLKNEKDKKNFIERVEKTNFADIEVHSTLTSWEPWTYVLKTGIFFEFSINNKKDIIEEPFPEPLQVVEIPDPPEPQPVIVYEEPEPLQEEIVNAEPLYKFLFVKYPPPRTSPTEQEHLAIIEEIARIMKDNPDAKLTCMGYSGSSPSPEAAYENALQRSIRIKYHLINFSGIDAGRISIFSHRTDSSSDFSENIDTERTECFIE